MKPLSFMLIAGEASGDLLAAELVSALRQKVLAAGASPTRDVQPLRTELAPRFFGAGGSKMKAAGVELAIDMMAHSHIGISDVLKNYLELRRVFHQLLNLAIERQPDVVIGVDYGGFNLRFGRAIKNYVRRHSGMFSSWRPKLVQFVSPQVWASRPGRAYRMAEDYDLVLSIFPFEKAWYARRVPRLRVEFVGHPMVDRYVKTETHPTVSTNANTALPHAFNLLLLPGSRRAELRRHLPVMIGALRMVQSRFADVHAKMVLPSTALAEQAKTMDLPPNVEIQIGNLPEALAQADLALASTGTVTMECAYFGVPAITLYKTSLSTYEIAKRIVTVKSLTMPNLMAGEEVYPEFVQYAATPKNLSGAAVALLEDKNRRQAVKTQLAKVVASLGGPGATMRAAEAIMRLFP